MKRKMQLKPVLQLPKWLADPMNMCFAQKILGKYGVGRWTGRFPALIFRQYRMLPTGAAGETDLGNAAAVKNYSHYFNVYTSVFNLTTQAIEPLHAKSKKDLPAPSNPLKNIQWNNLAYPGGKQGSEKGVSKLKYKHSSAGKPFVWSGRGQKEHEGSRETNIFNVFTVENLFQRISEKYSKIFRKKVDPVFEFSYFLPGLKGQAEREDTEAGWIELQQRQVLKERANKAPQIVPEPMGPLIKLQTAEKQLKALTSQIRPENKQYFPFGSSRTQGTDLLYDKNPLSEWKTLAPVFEKTYALEQRSLHNQIPDETGETQIGYGRPEIPVKEIDHVDAGLRGAKKTKALRAASSAGKGKLPGNRKEVFEPREMILHASLAKEGLAPKTYGFLKGALAQAEGAGFRFLNALSGRQAAGNLGNGFLTPNIIYQSRPELIPAELRQDGQAIRISKPAAREEAGKLSGKYEDGSLIFRKPPIKETVIETGQTPKDVLPRGEEVYAKAFTVSKPRKNFNAIGAEEVDLLAERVFKILEKRIAIQKDRRGLR